MVIDLGSHWMDGLGSSAVLGSPAIALQGVRLTQIVTRRLAPRAAHFPALATQRQVRLADAFAWWFVVRVKRLWRGWGVHMSPVRAHVS